MRRPDDLTILADRLGPAAVPDAPLGSRTTYRVGGTAALGAEVADEAMLADVARAADPVGLGDGGLATMVENPAKYQIVHGRPTPISLCDPRPVDI